MFLSDGTVISISLRVEFTESLTMISGLFAVIVLSLLTGMSHMMVLLSLLCITVSGTCSYHLSVISYHDPYIHSNGDMLQHYCAWRCTLFWLIPHIQIQYAPLSLHVANTFCICSPLAGHILLSGSFWCLLPCLELLQVVPLFLLSNYLTTICWW